MSMVNAEANGTDATGVSTHRRNGRAALVGLPTGRGKGQARTTPQGTATPPDTSAESAAHPPDDKTKSTTQLPVAEICKGRLDGRGEPIDFVYWRRPNYAIYRSGERIMAHYADDEKLANSQIAAVAELVSLRGRVQYLLKGVENKDRDAHHWQIAESLRLCLDGKKDAAKNIMESVIEELTAKCVSEACDAYLRYTGLIVMTIVALICAAIAALTFDWLVPPDKIPQGVSYLMMATGSGAMGAMLSIATAFRARTMFVTTTHHLRSNALDGAARILIGVVSGAMLCLVLDSHIVQEVNVGGLPFKPSLDWKLALLAGFAAGFLERLVPNMLERKIGAGWHMDDGLASFARISPRDVRYRALFRGHA